MKCKLCWFTHKLNIKPKELYLLCEIQQGLHVDKIDKNKIHSYYNPKYWERQTWTKNVKPHSEATECGNLGQVVQNLTELFANMMLKFLSWNMAVTLTLIFFAEKMWGATHIFSAKNINVFENTLATIVNKFVINKFVKLTMLWTTGPWWGSTQYATHPAV